MRRGTLADLADVNEWAGNDFSGFLSSSLNVCLIEGMGCAFFVWRGPGIYELHLALEQRGRAAIDTLHAMISAMRRDHGAKLMWAAIPVESRHVVMFARLMGWAPQGLETFPHGRCQLFTSETR